jgi:hypothetical protein
VAFGDAAREAGGGQLALELGAGEVDARQQLARQRAAGRLLGQREDPRVERAVAEGRRLFQQQLAADPGRRQVQRRSVRSQDELDLAGRVARLAVLVAQQVAEIGRASCRERVS